AHTWLSRLLAYARRAREDEHADAVLESALVRGLRRRRGLALPGQTRGLVVLVPDLARLPGGDAPGRAAARCASARPLRGRDGPYRARLRPRRRPHQHAVLPGRC